MGVLMKINRNETNVLVERKKEQKKRKCTKISEVNLKGVEEFYSGKQKN